MGKQPRIIPDKEKWITRREVLEVILGTSATTVLGASAHGIASIISLEQRSRKLKKEDPAASQEQADDLHRQAHPALLLDLGIGAAGASGTLISSYKLKSLLRR